MASHYACVACEDPMVVSSSGSCATCLKTASHDTDGSLCPGCFSQHEKGKGLWRGHDFSKDSRAATASSVLARAGLVACPTRCTEHGKAVEITCTTCQEPALCVSCLSKHPGHSLLVLVEAAPIARSLLREAAAGSFASIDVSATTAVEAARASAQRIARERDELPDRTASAAERIDALRDSLLAAVVARHAALRAALAATDAAVGAALAAELAVSDGLQQQANMAASDLAAAAEGLADADAVAHADALIDRSSLVRAAIASLPPRPATASVVALEVDAEAEAALLQGIAGLGRVVARGEGEKSAELNSLAGVLDTTHCASSMPAAPLTECALASASSLPYAPVRGPLPIIPVSYLAAAAAAAELPLIVARETDLAQVRSSLRRLEAAVGDIAAHRMLPPLHDFPAAMCRAAGYDARQLKASGFSASELKAGGFDAAALTAVGYDAAELTKAGFDASALKGAGFGVNALISAGVDAATIMVAGFDLPALRAGGVSASTLKSSGFDAGALKAAGFDARALKAAGFDARTLKATGFDAATLRATGFDAAALKPTGFDAATLKAVGFDAAAGFDAGALKAAGFDARALKAAGFDARTLKAAGFDAATLRATGFDAAALKPTGFDAAALKTAGFDAAALMAAGFDAATLKAVGFRGSELCLAGFNARALMDLGFDAFSLKADRCTLKAMLAAGFDVPTLKTHFAPVDFLRAGLDAASLKALGFSIPAGFTAADFRESGSCVYH